jgi:hypothetical protein
MRSRIVVCWEPDWWLTSSAYTDEDNQGTLGTYAKGPVRWWQREDGGEHLVEVPHGVLLPHTWSRGVDGSVPTCTIALRNVAPEEDSLGVQGGLAPQHGGWQKRTPGRVWVDRPDRWGRIANEYAGMADAGSVFRVYEGYGDPDKPWQEAIEDGDIVQTGVWIVDENGITHTDNGISLSCRGTSGNLLADQRLMSNTDGGIVPMNRAPLRYARWVWTPTPSEVYEGPSRLVELRTDYQQSSTDIHYPDAVRFYVEGGRPRSRGALIHGHLGEDAADTNPETYWFSEAYDSPNADHAMPWIEMFTWNLATSHVRIHTFGGPYEIYISILEDGAWKGDQNIPYDAGEDHLYTAADIPYVKRVSVPSNVATDIELPREFRAERIRLTFRNLKRFQWGPPYYRAGLRRCVAVLAKPMPGTTPPAGAPIPTLSKSRGNYTDYADIVRDVLLWAGYWMRPAADEQGFHRARGRPKVLASIETTGAYSDEPLPPGMFDRRPPIDVLTELADIVGYGCWEGPDGEIHWHGRNIYGPGNRDEFGVATRFIPVIHEAEILLDAKFRRTHDVLRGAITVASEQVSGAGDDIIATRYYPPFRGRLRGIQKPAIWTNGAFAKKAEQERMVELLAMRMWMASNTIVITIPGNPLLGPDDQVRIVDRLNSLDDIFYIHSVESNHDPKTGRWTMDLTCSFMGDAGRWAANPRPSRGVNPVWYERRRIRTEVGETWARLYRRIAGRLGRAEEVNYVAIRAMNTDQVPHGEEPDPDIWIDY